MADIILAKRVVDYVGLGAKGIPESQFRLLKELMPNLSLIQGMGNDGAKLINVDAAGNLQVTTAGQTAPGSVRVQDGAGAGLATVMQGNGITDSAAGLLGAAIAINDGAGGARGWRPASALVLALQQSNNAGLVTGPGQFSTSGNAGIGALSSASQAAGGAGVRHVLTGYEILISSQVAPAAGTLTINVRDGASGAGTIREQLVIQLPAALYAPIVIVKSGKALIGSAATAMTVEQSVGYAAVGVSITFEGYDAG